ncbi:HBR259Wp [Eremothecium sinecaudum]|uniref:Protein HIR n=1 Tax=Eremothecium sinecaudum TaxID=45286 RepID=A0A109UX75_9SACH|nr:HBR259Wp [Eremothecium sinecaudum]AMD19160.1 HBR259Wp [Eremothecium sinecaudum]
MKLLKYPKPLHDGLLSASCICGANLVLVGRNRISVWDCNALQETAQGKRPVKSLSSEFEIELSVSDDLPRYIVEGGGRLVVAGDRTIWRSDVDGWRELGEKTTFSVFKTFSEDECITDLKFDEVNGILFIGVSKINEVWLYSVASWEKVGTISLGVKPVTIIVDPIGELVTLVSQNRLVSIYQYDAQGSTAVHRQLNQHVQTNPLSYNITMSPQGDMLPVVNSIKNTTPSAQMLDRLSDFSVQSSLVGYVGKCKILKFSPRIYEKENKNKPSTRYNMIASAGNDAGNVTVWNTKRTKPLLNAAKLTTTFINDLQWSNDGTGLFAITNDGYLFIFAFQNIEIGKVLDVEEVLKMRKDIPRLEPLPAPVNPPSKANIKVVKDKKIDTSSNNGPAVVKASKAKIAPTVIKSTSVEFNAPSYSVPKDLKRKPKDEMQANKNAAKKQKKDLEPMDFLDTNLLMPNISFSKLRLATPKVRLNFQYNSMHNENLVMDINNGTGNEQKPSSLTVILKDKDKDSTLFQDFIPKFVTLCTAGDSFLSCCTEDGTVHVYSNTGRKLLAPMVMGVPISFLESCGDYLLCVTSMGQLYCWNIAKAKLKFPMNTVYPLLNPMLKYSDDVLTRAENLTMCTVTRNGIPLVTLSNGDGYLFDPDMETWMLVNDSWWAYGSQYWDFTNTSQIATHISVNGDKDDKKNKYWNADAEHLINEVKRDKQSIVNYLESKTNDEMSRKGRIRNLQRFAKTILMKEGFENLEDIVTLSHLENRILVSLKLDETVEFKKLLVVYCIRLAEMGFKNRLNDVLSWLYNDGNYKDEKIAGQNREDLLKQILVACADIRQVQRVTTSFASALEMLDETL